MLCMCMGYTHDEIEKMIADGDYKVVADFKEETFVGTGCGRCLPVVDEIFGRLKSTGNTPE